MTHPLFRPLDWACVGAIECYQRFVSPRKGWRCAYGVRHGGPGCSGYVKSAIREHGWRAAIPLARARFRACKAEAQTMRSERVLHGPGSSGVLNATPEGKRGRRTGAGGADAGGCDCSWLNIFDVFDLCDGCDSLHGCHVPDCTPCDCGPCDGPSCDCSPCS